MIQEEHKGPTVQQNLQQASNLLQILLSPASPSFFFDGLQLSFCLIPLFGAFLGALTLFVQQLDCLYDLRAGSKDLQAFFSGWASSLKDRLGLRIAEDELSPLVGDDEGFGGYVDIGHVSRQI